MYFSILSNEIIFYRLFFYQSFVFGFYCVLKHVKSNFVIKVLNATLKVETYYNMTMNTIQQKAENVCLQINELHINNWYLIGRTLQSVRASPIIDVTILFSVKLSNVLYIHRTRYENSLYLFQQFYFKNTICLIDHSIRSGRTILYFCQCWINVLKHDDCRNKNMLMDRPNTNN